MKSTKQKEGHRKYGLKLEGSPPSGGDPKITHLEGAVKAQAEEIERLKQQHQSKERTDRLKNLRIAGLNCHPDDAHKMINDLLTEKLGVHLLPSDFQTRVLPSKKTWHQSKQQGTGSDPSRRSASNEVTDLHQAAAAAAESKQTAIISFSNIWKRREVYSRKTQLRDTQVFISEDLPKEESALLFECRKLRRERLIKTCYSKDLAVFIRTNLGSEVQITSKSDLQKYSTDSTPARSSTPLGPVNISDHSVETSSMYMYSASQLPDNSIDEEETFYGFGEEQMRT